MRVGRMVPSYKSSVHHHRITAPVFEIRFNYISLALGVKKYLEGDLKFSRSIVAWLKLPAFRSQVSRIRQAAAPFCGTCFVPYRAAWQL